MLYDQATAASTDCSATAGAPPTYCVVIGGLGPNPRPTGEAFSALNVRGSPAQVDRSFCCGDPTWILAWYDEGADTSYAVTVMDDPTPQFKQLGANPAHISVAQLLVRWAEQLVPYSSGDNVASTAATAPAKTVTVDAAHRLA